jgi:cell division transport system permease protein
VSRERVLRRDGAISSRAGLLDRGRAWLSHHRDSAADSLGRLLARPLGSLLTCLAIGIVLALPAVLAQALEEFRQLSGGWQAPDRISLFLRESVSEEAALAWREELEALPAVARVDFLSRDDALVEFRELSGFADVLDGLEQNPLPHLLLVAPAASEQAAQLRARLLRDERVAEAVLDSAWLARLQQLTDLGRRVVWVLGGLLLLGVVLILGNTLRLAIESRREEILVVKLVGGSDAFVRRPFLYTGLWYGVGGGLCAGLLVVAVFALVGPAATELAALYGTRSSPLGPEPMAIPYLVLLGAVLGLAGAWLAVSRHLGDIEPS